jgi:hypothetical protein
MLQIAGLPTQQPTSFIFDVSVFPEELSVHGKEFSGTISSTIGKLTNLFTIAFQDTNLYGHLPSEIGVCTQLDHFDIEQSRISGTVPTEFEQLSNISKFCRN